MPGRPGSVGPVDVELKRYGKKIKNKKRRYETKSDLATSSQTVDKISWASSSGSNDEESTRDPSFESPTKKKIKTRNLAIEVTSDTVRKTTLTADISRLSVRKQLKYTAALITAGGGDIDQVKLSKTTIQRERQTIRKENLSKIQQNNEELLQSEDSFWVLH